MRLYISDKITIGLYPQLIFAIRMDGEILHHAYVEKESGILWTQLLFVTHKSMQNCVPHNIGTEYYRLSMHHSLRLFCKTKLFLNRNQQPRDGTQIDLC